MKESLFLVGIATSTITNTLESCKELNLDVIIVDTQEMFETHEKLVPETITKDYVDISNYNDLLACFEKHNSKTNIRYIFSFREVALLSVSKIAEKYALFGVKEDVVRLTIDKNRTRKILRKAGLDQTDFEMCKTLEEAQAFFHKHNKKIVLKPNNLAGSVGVKVIEKDTDLKEYFEIVQTLSNTGEVLLEQYIDGKEYSIEMLVFDKNVHIIGITEKFLFKDTVVESGHVVPAPQSEMILNSYQGKIEKIVDVLGIEFGPAFLEVKINHLGLFIIEAHTRYSGDKIVELIQYAFKKDIVRPIFDYLVHKKTYTDQLNCSDYYSIQYFSCPEEPIKNIIGVDSIVNLPEIVTISNRICLNVINDKIDNSNNRKFFVLFHCSSYISVQQIVDKVIETVILEMEDGSVRRLSR
ncbi:ATP-grasp domain-containing protein [Enterococcus quebecensis]|uniref:ATP-grasp domain-containing protein n=1 Tax=Enterococcus quebecensis TaxID=903983 RepID=A0A1E5GVM0_9ENTE|nr:ATP-grasp domain-containing protein [Enterococcus quebecensis]OEG16340.1 hypothetical protein BCR23_05475 [Enterococcus quebecensis]OJG72790.1 hypothetical protein RV12_GL000888 [Enterococcus quebecensis]